MWKGLLLLNEHVPHIFSSQRRVLAFVINDHQDTAYISRSFDHEHATHEATNHESTARNLLIGIIWNNKFIETLTTG
jgi:hypothetical protein